MDIECPADESQELHLRSSGLDDLLESADYNDDSVSPFHDGYLCGGLLDDFEDEGRCTSGAGPSGAMAFSSENSGRGPQSQRRFLNENGKRRHESAKEFLKPMDYEEKPVKPATSTNFDFHVQDCCLKLARANSIKLPWDEPFGKPFSFAMLQPPSLDVTLLSRHSTSAKPARPESDQRGVPTWASESPFQSRRLLAARFAKSDDDLRNMALNKLRNIVLYDPNDSQLGRSLVQAAGMLVAESEVMRSFLDCFSGKATGTLVKRAADFNRFALWQISSNHARPLNPSEQDLYRYLNHLRDSGAAPTTGASFIKAWNFMRHTVGVKPTTADDCLSGRVQGIAKSMFLFKRKLKQADPLPAELVWQLERRMFATDIPASHAAILGFLLFCLYSASRRGQRVFPWRHQDTCFFWNHRLDFTRLPSLKKSAQHFCPSLRWALRSSRNLGGHAG